MPVTAGLVIGGGQALLGLGQTLFSGKKKAETNLENYAKSYQPNASILDYYNKALAQYNPNAYNSAAYQNSVNLNQRNLAAGLNASSSRRGGLGVLSGLIQGTDDADARAAANAETQQRANLSLLGGATEQKANEDRRKYDMMYNLLAAKAGGANAVKSAGMQNISRGFQTAGNIVNAAQMYGDTNKFNRPLPNIF